jgi:hypothetical protein
MKSALYLFLAYPRGLIVTGTVLSILGLIVLALFSRRDVDSTEDPLDDRPKFSDKETRSRSLSTSTPASRSGTAITSRSLQMPTPRKPGSRLTIPRAWPLSTR